MKIYFDDLRTPLTTDRVVVRSYKELIKLIDSGQVTELDLDYHIESVAENAGYNGESVLDYLEKQLFTNPQFKLPDIYIHTSDSGASRRMREKAGWLNSIAETSFNHRRK